MVSARAVLKADRDIRIRSFEAVYKVDQKSSAKGRAQSDPKPLPIPVSPGRLRKRLLKHLIMIPDAFYPVPSLHGQMNAIVASLEELKVELLLDRRNVPADRGFSHLHAKCHLAHASKFGCGENIFQAAQGVEIHCQASGLLAVQFRNPCKSRGKAGQRN